ncbi:MAG: DUF2809 domain-containing protein [Bacteroidales bacterium]|nr:DUF2809 domain-containing protein [Bacteroidales bacterium]MCF8402591.1 DUF2809 domain-containing protein [Bacteroidales bacterium]
MSRYRLLLVLALIVIVPIGFLTKFYTGPAQSWVNDSLGGLFYEIFWCLVFGFIFQKTKAIKIALIVCASTCFLEFLQLWDVSFLEKLRGTFLGQTILGNSFNWLDFPYYFVGSFFGFLFLIQFKKLSK